jgi:hypothetical protein
LLGGKNLDDNVCRLDIGQRLEQLWEALARLKPFPDTLRFTAWCEAVPLVGWSVKIIRQILPVVSQAPGKRQLLSASKHVSVRSYWAPRCQMVWWDTRQRLQPVARYCKRIWHAWPGRPSDGR